MITKSKKAKGLRVRTSNRHEELAIQTLLDDDWEVLKRGWPDILAIKDGKVRFIEVKDGNTKLKPHQKRVSEILSYIGITVEVWRHGKEPK